MLNPRHRRSPKNLTLNDVYDDWLTGGGVISSLTTAPWHSSVSDTGLDLAYHGTHSGGKFITALLYNFVDDDGHITVSGYSAVATMLMAKYGAKWSHLWNLYATQYNPLNSYDLSETETLRMTGTETTDVDSDKTRVRTQTVGENGSHDFTSTRTPDITESVTGTDEKVIEGDTLRTPDITETKTLNGQKVIDGTTVRTPALRETVTKSDTTDLDSTTTRTDNLTETVDKDAETVLDSETVRTPNLTERTVTDEQIQLTGNEEDETVHGHVVTTEDDKTHSASLNVFGFNSATAVPKEATSGTDTDDSTVTNSGTDTTTKDTTSTTDRDNTTTKTSTGTERVEVDSTETLDETDTRRNTGTQTTVIDSTEILAGSEVKASSGTESTDEDTTETNTESGSLRTTGTERTEVDTTETLDKSESRRTTGTDTTRDAGTDSSTTTNNDRETNEDNQTTELTVDRTNAVTKSKQGNVFKSPAELLSIDRDFWLTEFFDIVFSDIDQLLTLGIYAESPVRYKIY